MSNTIRHAVGDTVAVTTSLNGLQDDWFRIRAIIITLREDKCTDVQYEVQNIVRPGTHFTVVDERVYDPGTLKSLYESLDEMTARLLPYEKAFIREPFDKIVMTINIIQSLLERFPNAERSSSD